MANGGRLSSAGEIHPDYELTLSKTIGEAKLSDKTDTLDVHEAIASAAPEVRDAYARMRQPPRYELYDLKSDPWETTNLMGEAKYTSIAESLKKEIKDWESSTDHAPMYPISPKIGRKRKGNVIAGRAVVTGTGNRILAHTDQAVVVAHDNVTVVVTDNTVYVGDADTDMKALVESVGKEAPELL